MKRPIDNNGNVHGDDGRFVSLGALFERERVEHNVDHDRERIVVGETARRLEREVEETARRLERMVEETATRLEKGVAVALKAVADTALVHSDAHMREHHAHERIHAVEKIQVDKAEQSMNKRLEGMNEFRAALQDQSSKAVTREYYDVRHEELKEKVALVEKRMAYYAGAAAAAGAGIAVIIRLAGF